MKIAVIKERRQFEERVSCTPEIVKKFINLGFKVSVQSESGISPHTLIVIIKVVEQKLLNQKRHFFLTQI